MPDVLERLRVLIDSSTPIVILETVEETRAVRLVHAAALPLNLAVFEWTIASGLVRCSNDAQPNAQRVTATPHGVTTFSAEASAQAIYNSRDPSQALSNLEAISTEAVFILKDFHRHMADPVVVRKLRDVGQKFSSNRRTVVITAPTIEVPPELASLVEFLELPLPDKPRLRQMVDEVFMRLAQGHNLRRTLDPAGLELMAENLRGLTEEEADRPISHAIVNRRGLTTESITDVLDAKKDLLRHSGSLEFIDASDKLSSVGGLDNLKQWLAQRRGSWEDSARKFGLDPARGVIILGVQGCGKSLCAQAIAGEWKLPLVKFDSASIFD